MENNYSNIISGFFEGSDFALIELLQKGNKGNLILEVFVDKKDIFNIDELAKINKDLWKHIEEKDADKGILKIIVSSPGAEKPLKFFWQLKKHIGRELEIKLKNGGELTGKLEELNDSREELNILVKIKKEFKNTIVLFGEVAEVKIKLSFKK